MPLSSLCTDSSAVRKTKELQKLLKQAIADHDSTIAEVLSAQGITWQFNPPRAPHFGGLWEAGVKSFKFHYKRIIGPTTLNFEEMTTLAAQIEAILNSRPISSISTDPEDLTALTPGHFLVGEPLTVVSEPTLTTIPENRLSRWQLCQTLKQHFWKRWSTEYLSTLQKRTKWREGQSNLKLDQLVIVKEDFSPPQHWKMGRIRKLHPGKDGQVRVVTIHTTSGERIRPVTKIIPLPGN